MKPQTTVRRLRKRHRIPFLSVQMRQRLLRKDETDGVANFAKLEFEDHAVSVITDVITRNPSFEGASELQLLPKDHPRGLGHVLVTAAAQVDEDDLILAHGGRHLAHLRGGMGAFERGDDALHGA